MPAERLPHGLLSRLVAAGLLAALALSAQPPKLVPEAPGWGRFGTIAFRAPERARRGMVASADETASRAGVEIMRQGGNAVDAAVAVAFALAVTFPEAGNIAGGGIAVIRMADGRSAVIDYREQAPASARAGMFADSGEAWFGYRSIAVPGTLAGLAAMHERFGSRPWAPLLEPARHLAHEGWPVSFRAEATLNLTAARLKLFPDAAAVFMPGGRLPQQNEILRQPQLAATIATLQKRGWREFYEGELARAMVADIREHGGIVTFEDWKSYRAEVLQPLEGVYRGRRMLAPPPAATWGGVGLFEMLNILERFPLSPAARHSTASWHLIIETMRRAYYDRERWYRKPGLEFTAKDYAASVAKLIDPTRATPGKELAVPGGGGEQTTHFSVVDGQGNMVSNGYTLQGALGSTVMPKGTGVLISGGMSYFSAGCACANEIGPRKRPIYSMAPAIVLNERGEPWLAVGTPGDYTIPAQILQVIANLVDFGMPLREAVDAPRIYHRYTPDRVNVEPDAFTPDTEAQLKAMGHSIALRTRPLGDVHTVMIDAASGWRLGWSDGRAGGRAAGF